MAEKRRPVVGVNGPVTSTGFDMALTELGEDMSWVQEMRTGVLGMAQ